MYQQYQLEEMIVIKNILWLVFFNLYFSQLHAQESKDNEQIVRLLLKERAIRNPNDKIILKEDNDNIGFLSVKSLIEKLDEFKDEELKKKRDSIYRDFGFFWNNNLNDTVLIKNFFKEDDWQFLKSQSHRGTWSEDFINSVSLVESKGKDMVFVAISKPVFAKNKDYAYVICATNKDTFSVILYRTEQGWQIKKYLKFLIS